MFEKVISDTFSISGNVLEVIEKPVDRKNKFTKRSYLFGNTNNTYSCIYDSLNNPIEGAHVSKTLNTLHNSFLRLRTIFFMSSGRPDSSLIEYKDDVLGKGIYEKGEFYTGYNMIYGGVGEYYVERYDKEKLIESYEFKFDTLCSLNFYDNQEKLIKSEYYNSIGTTIASGIYDENLGKIGSFIEMEKGRPVLKTYANNILNGVALYWLTTNNISDTTKYTKINFENNLKQGLSITRYNGRNIAEGIYKNNRPYDGSFLLQDKNIYSIEVYSNGILKETSLLNRNFQKIESSLEKSDSNLQINREIKYENGYYSEYSNGKKNGISFNLNHAGDTSSRYYYINDIKNGPYKISRIKNGTKVMYEGEYRDGHVYNGMSFDKPFIGVIKNGIKNGLFEIHGKFFNGTTEFSNNQPVKSHLKITKKFNNLLDNEKSEKLLLDYFAINDSTLVKYEKGNRKNKIITHENEFVVFSEYDKDMHLVQKCFIFMDTVLCADYREGKIISGYELKTRDFQRYKIKSILKGNYTGDSIVNDEKGFKKYRNGKLHEGRIIEEPFLIKKIKNGKIIELMNHCFCFKYDLVADTYSSCFTYSLLNHELKIDNSGNGVLYTKFNNDWDSVVIQNNKLITGTIQVRPNVKKDDTEWYYNFIFQEGTVSEVILLNETTHLELSLQPSSILNRIDYLDVCEIDRYIYPTKIIKIINSSKNLMIYKDKEYDYELFFTSLPSRNINLDIRKGTQTRKIEILSLDLEKYIINLLR